MNDIRNWLEAHALGEYVEAFLRERIGPAQLAELTEDDLRELGLPMGPRKELLRLVREQAGAIAASSERSNGAPETHPRSDAEHRQLTVMFCDLVGSVDLGEQMDVEDYRELLGRFRNAVVGAVEEYDGFIARHHGDGLLVYFGFPQAHEDDAERSVRAGLGVVHAIENLDQPYRVIPRVRVGIATGPAVVGDVLATGASERSEFAALGPTPNLAARLQGEAAPNSVAISETTHRLVQGFFLTESLGSISLKGFRDPVPAYRVTGQTGIRSRFERQDGIPRTPMVGRDVELALLRDRWGKARESHGQIVLIAAAPGVGKSRLGSELVGHLRAEPMARVTLYCSPYHSDAPLHPVIEAIRAVIRRERSGAFGDELSALEGWLRSLEIELASQVPLIAPLLGISIEGHYPALEISDEERRSKTLQALVDVVVSLSEQSPVFLFAEDLHWVDPTTQELLGRLMEAARERRILGLFTFRPEYECPWRPDTHLTLLTLNHLTSSECRTLIESVSGSGQLAAHLVEGISARSDGVPLYLEELCRSVIEQGADEASVIPDTLRDALTARLDRLGANRETLQLASVLGRQFDSEVLRAVQADDVHNVDSELDALRAEDLIHRRGQSQYEFKHALIRDIAYESMLKSKRQSLHEKVADALVRMNARAPEDACESIAYHYGASTRAADAAKFLVMSATKAVGQYAHREAIELLGRALKHADSATTPLDASCTPARILLKSAQSSYFVGDFGGGTHTLKREIGRLEPELDLEVAAEWNFWLSHMVLRFGQPDDAIAAARRAIEIARRIDDSSTMGKAHGVLVMVSEHTGDLRAGEAEAAASMALLEKAGEPYWLGMTHFYLGWVQMNAGRFRDALKSAREAERLADEIKDDRLKAYALFGQSWTYGMAGSSAEALRYAKAAVDTAPDQSSAVHAWHMYACACFHEGQFEEAARLFQQSVKDYQKFQYPAGLLRSQVMAAGAFFELGDVHQAGQFLQDAEQTARGLNYPYGSGLMKMVSAKLAAKRNEHGAAVQLLQRALTDFESAGAQDAIHRTHTLLGSCYRSLGDGAKEAEQIALARAVEIQRL